MSLDDVGVILGSVGTEARTKRINNMLDILDERIAEVREQNKEKIRVSTSDMATELNVNKSTVNRNGFPSFFLKAYECTSHRTNKGMIVDVEEWVEERKEQRERIHERKQE